MTILCAMTDGTDTAIGSDTAFFNGHTVRDMGESKFTRWRSGWHVGISGSWRLASLARELLRETATWDAYGLAEALRKFAKSDEWKKNEPDGDPWNVNASGIMARPGEVWEIGGDFAVFRVPTGTLATGGAGWELATGAGYALANVGGGGCLSIHHIVRGAVEAAIARSVWCGGVAVVETLRGSD